MARKIAATPEIKKEAANGKRTASAAPTRPQSMALRGVGNLPGKGFENLERGDILLPRVTLLQPLSSEVTEGGQKAGTIFLNLSNKNLGKEVLITPVLHFRSRIKWNPRDDGGGIDCSSSDAKVPTTNKYAEQCAVCKHKEWDNEAKTRKDQAPACTLYENFVVLLPSETGVVVLPMERTKTKVAKKFYSMAALKGGDMFDFTYKLSTTQEKNADGQTYFNYQVADIGKVTSEKERAQANKIWAALQQATIRTEERAPEESIGAVQQSAASKNF